MAMDLLLASISYQPIQRWGPVSPHGVGTMLGFLLGAIITARRAEQRGIPRDEMYNAVTWGALGAILGARGFYVLAHADNFSSITDVLAVWRGGLTMFGGFVGGLVFGVAYIWRKRFPLGLALDSTAPGFVIGVIIGRIGDLIIADHLGRTTNFVLGYKIPAGAHLAPGYGPPMYVPGVVVHQTALYDLVGALLLGGFLLLLERRPLPVGAAFSTFSLWYGLERFFIDFTRNRVLIESSFFGLSGSQWAGLMFAVTGLIGFVLIKFRKEPLATKYAANESPAGPVPEDLPIAAPPPPARDVALEPVIAPDVAAPVLLSPPTSDVSVPVEPELGPSGVDEVAQAPEIALPDENDDPHLVTPTMEVLSNDSVEIEGPVPGTSPVESSLPLNQPAATPAATPAPEEPPVHEGPPDPDDQPSTTG